MQDYLLLFHGGDAVFSGLSPEEMQGVMMRWSAWMKSLRDKGIHKGGEPLEAGGAVVSPDGTVTDGPFAETKEAIAGFVMISAKSLQEAIDLSQDCPIKLTGGSIEVRPVMDIELPSLDGEGTINPCAETEK